MIFICDVLFAPSMFPHSPPEMTILPPRHLESEHFSHSKVSFGLVFLDLQSYLKAKSENKSFPKKLKLGQNTT
jgi:hypothetical protein